MITMFTFRTGCRTERKIGITQYMSCQVQGKNCENTLLFSITGQLLIGLCGFCLNNRPKGARNIPGLSFPRYPASFYHSQAYFEKHFYLINCLKELQQQTLFVAQLIKAFNNCFFIFYIYTKRIICGPTKHSVTYTRNTI